MAELTVASTYARALFEAARDNDKIDLIRDELDELMQILETEKDLKAFALSPAIPIREKKQVLETIFENRLSQELVNFLYILADKGRINQIDRIARQYKEHVSAFEGYTSGTIYSVKLLEQDKLAEFEKQVSKLLRVKVRLYNEIDTKLIGGVKILVDGKLIDASVKKQLGTMLEDLKK